MVFWILTGGLIPWLLLAVGIFFIIYLKGGPLRHPIRMLREFTKKPKEGAMSPRRALLLALAGTLGVGNLVGVANAVWVGGPGAVLWMWLSALVGMILKYAEILLAVAHRRVGRDGFFGGSYYYITDELHRRRFGRLAVWVGGGVAVLMIANALSMGCIIQANAVSTSFSEDGTTRSRMVICIFRAAAMISSNLSCETMESVSISMTPVRFPYGSRNPLPMVCSTRLAELAARSGTIV